MAYLSPITYFDVEEVIEKVIEDGRAPLLLLLDNITDVRNFGAIARTAECMGVDAIVLPMFKARPLLPVISTFIIFLNYIK